MATRSTIAIEREDGSVAQVYCHYDGGLDHNGALLDQYWSNPEKLEQLIALGDLSSLNKSLAGCIFYSRDRGQDHVDADIFTDFDEYYKTSTEEEFNYILRRDGQWEVRESDKGHHFLPMVNKLNITVDFGY